MVLLSACLGMGMEKRFKFEPPTNCSISTLNYDPGDGILKVENNNIEANSVFVVKPADYNIKIPRIVRNNIAKEVEVTVRMVYEPME